MFVRIVKPKRFGDVARRFVSRCGGKVLEWREGFLMTLEGAGSGADTRRLK